MFCDCMNCRFLCCNTVYSELGSSCCFVGSVRSFVWVLIFTSVRSYLSCKVFYFMPRNFDRFKVDSTG